MKVRIKVRLRVRVRRCPPVAHLAIVGLAIVSTAIVCRVCPPAAPWACKEVAL